MIVLAQMISGVTMARFDRPGSQRLALARPWLKMNEKMRACLHDYHNLMQEVSDEMLEESVASYLEGDPDKVNP